MLSKFLHSYVVSLLGYCEESGNREMILIYEYMSNGSLYDHLHKNRANGSLLWILHWTSSNRDWLDGLNTTLEKVVSNNKEPKTKTLMKFTYTELRNATRNFQQDSVIGEGGFEGVEPLPWHTRIKIAIGATQGLAFLLSSENNDYNAKLLDFVLAKLGPHNGESHVTTRVEGTYDFMAPEYIATGHIYIKSNVYAFGMVMLEIITALRAMVTKRYGREQNLLDWGRPFLSGKKGLQKIMDPRLIAKYSTKAASKITELILICLRIDPKQCPSKDKVVSELQLINEIKKKPRLSNVKTRQSSDWHQQNHCWSPFGTKQETEAWSASTSS
nr:probable serine/threonine-protein kinase PIX13 [Tanacetum cinerariifolium]